MNPASVVSVNPLANPKSHILSSQSALTKRFPNISLTCLVSNHGARRLLSVCILILCKFGRQSTDNENLKAVAPNE
jgi:hypothetical protein